MSDFLRKDLSVKLKLEPRGGDESGSDKTFVIAGLANSGQPDRWDEVMPQDCWDLKHFEANPIMLYNHNHSMPIGRVIKIQATENGLEFVAEIGVGSEFGLTQVQKDVRSLIAQGILNTLSVGFIAKDWAWEGRNGKDVLVYKSAELTEISVVTVPMDAGAVITGAVVKSHIGSNSKGGEMPLEYKDVKEIVKESLGEAIKSITEQAKANQESLVATVIKSEEAKKEVEAKLSALEQAKKELEDKLTAVEAELKEANEYIEQANATLSELAGEKVGE